MKNTRKTTVFDSQKQASASLGIPLNKLRAAKQSGCDAFCNGRVDSRKLMAWIDAHKAPAARPPEPLAPVLAAKGTPANLEALERAAANLWNDYEAARKSGDPEQALYLKSWLECSEQLRRHDRDVSASRRVGMESIPRADIENLLGEILHTWATALKLQLIGIGYSLHKASPDEARDILDTVAHEGLREAIATARSWNAGRPAWLYDAVLSNLRHVYSAKQMKALAS